MTTMRDALRSAAARLRNQLLAALLCAPLAIGGALWVAAPVTAQVPSANAPFNVDLGALISTTIGTGISGTGTVTSSTQFAVDKPGVTCALKINSSSGSASTTFAIQTFDVATNTWSTMLTTTLTNTAVPYYILSLSPGIATSGLPTGMSAINLHLTYRWRVSLSVSGTSSINSSVGCNYLR